MVWSKRFVSYEIVFFLQYEIDIADLSATTFLKSFRFYK